MRKTFPLFPEQASTVAGSVDELYFFLVATTCFFVTIIFFLVIYFAVRYRRRPEDGSYRPKPIHGNLALELTWTIIPLLLTAVMFVWGSKLFFHIKIPPGDAIDVHAIGKQWMWKLQHMQGRREINELHIPVGQPVKLTMTSEDVIHSFFVPAFRVKMDVIPGRYTSLWFEPTRVGEYHLFCAEYCGTKHSKMVGKIVVMEPADFSVWLSGGPGEDSPVSAGRHLFQTLGCAPCHGAESGARGPALDGLFGAAVKLQDGRAVAADETYLRESILDPRAKLVAGFEAIMPTNYRDLITEEGILQIVTYIKSLRKGETKEGSRP